MTGNTRQSSSQSHAQYIQTRRWVIVGGAILAVLFVFFVIFLVLALTVFRVKQPRTELLSVTVDGLVPRVTFPSIRVDVNLTLDLKLLVENPNHASFRHGSGNSLVRYRGNRVGQVDIDPGFIPARRSETLGCRLALDEVELASNVGQLIGDVVAGEIVLESYTRIPGRVALLGGLFKRHVIAMSYCQMAVGIPDVKIREEDCRHKTKS